MTTNSPIFNHNKQHPQQNRLEKKLNREYINLAKELEKISKYPRHHIEHQWNPILDRQLQIVLELEHLM